MEAFALITSKSRFPQAVTAIQSIRRFHQEQDIWVCMMDAQPDRADYHLLSGTNAKIITLEALGIENLHQMLLRYTVVEMCSSLKPFLADYLFEEHGYESVILSDSDLYFFGDVLRVFELLREKSLVLTPHVIEPLDPESMLFAERRLLQTGVMNLGFIGLSKSIDPKVMKWWKWHMARYCLNEPAKDMFYDQRWIDLIAPTVPGVYFLNDPSYNVAFWNLSERELSLADGQYLVNGKPIVFFHFSAIKIMKPFSSRQDYPWLSDRNIEILEELQAFYSAELCRNGYQQYIDIPYGNEQLPNGYVRDEAIRMAYRLASEQEQTEIGNPHQDPTGLIKWLREKVAADSSLTRYDYGFWLSHPELRKRFPRVVAQSDEYLRYIRSVDWKIQWEMVGESV